MDKDYGTHCRHTVSWIWADFAAKQASRQEGEGEDVDQQQAQACWLRQVRRILLNILALEERDKDLSIILCNFGQKC